MSAADAPSRRTVQFGASRRLIVGGAGLAASAAVAGLCRWLEVDESISVVIVPGVGRPFSREARATYSKDGSSRLISDSVATNTV